MRTTRRRDRGACVLLLLLAAALPAFAEEPSFRAEVDARKVGLNDQLQLTLTLEGSSLDLAGDVAVPPLQNLRIVGGPRVSTQVSFVNGAVSQTRVHTYVLQPLAVGRAEVGAARVRLAGGEKTTAPIPVEVVPGSVLSRARRPADPFGSDPFSEDPFDSVFGGRRARGPEGKLFVEAVPSRTRLHVGEPLLLTYYLYTQVSVTDLQFGDAPKYPGFWAEDLEKPKGSPGGEPATAEGERYHRFPVLQKLLYPTRAGTLTIPPSTLRVGLQRGFFDARAGVLERSTRPVTVTAEPIPEGPDFSGAVGRFRTSVSTDKTSVAFGEAATVRFRVEGSGNLKWIDRGPELAVPGAKVFPPQVKSDLKPGPAGIGGSKTWEYVVVPETAGTLEVPALSFAYFDPEVGRIVRTETAAIPLQVHAGHAGAAGAAPAPIAATTPIRASGGLALRSDLDLPQRLVPAPSGRVVAAVLGLALLLHAVLGVAGLVSARRPRAAGLGKAPRRTVRSALADLQRAGRDGMNKEASAALIERTLHDVFGPRGELAASAAGTEERERAARAVLDEVRFLRYAPQLGDYSEKIREVAARAAEVVRRWA